MARLLRPRSIRAQVTAMVALVTLPMTGLLVWAGVREYRDTAAFQERTALTLSEAVAVSAGQFMAQAENLLTNAARELAPNLTDPATCPSVAGPIRSVLDFLSNVLVVRMDGSIICSSTPIPPGELDHVLDKPWFQAAVADTGFVVGPPRIGAITRRWVAGIATVIHDADGRPLGILAGSVDLADFQGLLTRVRLHEDELLTITTADGMVLARSHDWDRWVGTRIPDVDLPEEEVFPGGWLLEAPDMDGVDRAFGKVLVPGLGWKVSLGIPLREARLPALVAVARWTALSMALLLLGLLLAWSMYRDLDRSLDELRAGARAAAEGAPVTVSPDAPEEVLSVAAALNTTLESRAAAQQAERKAKERYRGILDNAVFGIYVTTGDGRFEQANPALATMLGYDDPEALMAVGIANVYRRPEQRRELTERYAQEGVFSDIEVEWVRRDGTPVLVRLNGKTIRGPEGGTLFEVMVEDITEERRREEELRHHQRLEAVGQLAGGIAHDFNNIITVIGGNTQMIQAGLDPDDPLQADVAQIADATQRAAQLTGQLLSFSRKSPVEPRPVDLSDLLDRVARMLGRVIGEDIALTTSVAPETRPAYADPGRVEQVLVNLVLNSRDALPGGGTISVEAANVSGSGGTDRVVLTVTDDGLGMDDETLSRVFEPFFTTKQSGRGTGLGLANAYRIVREAGGEITVTSTPGVGTRFDVYLPAASGGPVALPATSAGEARAGAAQERILVVEDQESVRNLLTRILEREGYTVLAARDGVDALDTIEREGTGIDLVLTDVIMPRMKGPELAVRLETVLPGVPVLFMSGYLDNAELRDEFSRTPRRFLAKPFTAQEVVDRVRFVLDEPGGEAPPRRAAPL